MWTKKSITVLAGGVVIAFIALIARSVQLILVSIFLFSYLLASLFTVRLPRVIPHRRISSEKTFEGGDITAELDIINKGGRTGFLEVRDKLPQQLDIKEGSNYLIVDLKNNEATTIRYRFESPLRGIFQIGPINLRSQDVYALFYKEASVEDMSTLTVFPRVEDVKDIYVRAKSMKLYPGAMPVKQPGPGSEFFLIRNYVPGDPFKNINWKAYARSGDLLVNEKEREAVSDIMIILDAREVSTYGTEADNSLMYGARAAATLTNFFLKRRDSVGLLIYGERLLSLKQGQGQKQFFEILTALAGARGEGNLPFKGVIDYAAPFMPKRSPVVIISSLESDETFAAGISVLRVLDFPVIIVSPNSVEFEVMARAKTRLGVGDPTPYDILKLERDVIVADLRGYGANVIDWDPKTPLLAVLRETRK